MAHTAHIRAIYSPRAAQAPEPNIGNTFSRIIMSILVPYSFFSERGSDMGIIWETEWPIFSFSAIAIYGPHIVLIIFVYAGVSFIH